MDQEPENQGRIIFYHLPSICNTQLLYRFVYKFLYMKPINHLHGTLINRDKRGRKGSMIAVIQGTKADDIIAVLTKMPQRNSCTASYTSFCTWNLSITCMARGKHVFAIFCMLLIYVSSVVTGKIHPLGRHIVVTGVWLHWIWPGRKPFEWRCRSEYSEGIVAFSSK